jgi:histidine ammonia-lyase
MDVKDKEIMLIIGEKKLSINDVIKVASQNSKISLGKKAIERINLSEERLIKLVKQKDPVYGINTGFGIFADKRIKENESNILNRNLILSHAVGMGDPLSDEITRAAMIVRANTLSNGYSGVRRALIQTIIDMINKGVTPIVPSQGSLGSSGDLCPLSHMALVFTTDDADNEEESGMAHYDGKIISGKQAMALAGIPRMILGPKEGLALNNGATFSTAIGALTLFESRYLADLADRITAATLEALLGCSAAFDPRIHQVRGQLGQIDSADRISKSFAGSSLIDSTKRVQDAYSLRCAPQIHGSVRDTIQFADSIITREINATTDNPLIFEPAIALSGGNFHGEPVGMVMDYLGIALCELGAISERRIFRLTDEKLNNGLPPMLVDSNEAAGLNSGMMMPQYTAASLVLENQTLATPDSIHSLPTSAEQEDHNANAMTAARHANEIMKNVRHILSTELYTAIRAIDLRKREQTVILGKETENLYQKIRDLVPYRAGDTLWGLEITKVNELIVKHSL